MKYTKERTWYANALWFLFSLLGMFLIPSLIYYGLIKITTNNNVCELISNFIFIIILYLVYFKDINSEAKLFKANIKENLKIGFKYYFVGLGIMVISNLIINTYINNIACNEGLVRDMLFSETLYTMVSIVLVAPLTEELIFRKSIMPLIKNKWIYALCCGILFGFAHLLSCKITLISLLYLIPYGSLGFVFALMNYQTKTTFTSISMHFIHNTFTSILLLVTYMNGSI